MTFTDADIVDYFFVKLKTKKVMKIKTMLFLYAIIFFLGKIDLK